MLKTQEQNLQDVNGDITVHVQEGMNKVANPWPLGATVPFWISIKSNPYIADGEYSVQPITVTVHPHCLMQNVTHPEVTLKFSLDQSTQVPLTIVHIPGVISTTDQTECFVDSFSLHNIDASPYSESAFSVDAVKGDLILHDLKPSTYKFQVKACIYGSFAAAPCQFVNFEVDLMCANQVKSNNAGQN
jgi:hypothetical protein